MTAGSGPKAWVPQADFQFQFSIEKEGQMGPSEILALVAALAALTRSIKITIVIVLR